MTRSRKFSSALVAVGCVFALTVAASPASAQPEAQTGSIIIKAGKVGASGRVSASVSLPTGASMTGKVFLGKRVLCRAAKKKASTDGALTEIGCRFPLRALVVKKSRSSQNGRYAPFVVLSIAIRNALAIEGVPEDVPIVLTFPIGGVSFETPLAPRIPPVQVPVNGT